MDKLNRNEITYCELQDLLIKEAGHHCQDCGAYHNPAVNRPLRMYFIDNDSANRSSENVRILCYPCIRLRSRVTRRRRTRLHLQHALFPRP